LLYQFDEVARYRDSTMQKKNPLVKYFRLSALGEAIVRAAGGRATLASLTGDPLVGPVLTSHREMLLEAFGPGLPDDAVTAAMLLPEDETFAQAEPGHRIVLIDELDKAPRDTPNDLLAEIEDMGFRIPELGLSVQVPTGGLRPVVVITSNSEKSLPDPFLRRCAYFDIPFPRRYDRKTDKNWPGQGTLEQIVEGRLDAFKGGGQLLEQSLEIFQRLRQPERGIRKVPGTAELLAWLDAMVSRGGLKVESDLKANLENAQLCLAAALKNKEDIDTARAIVSDWSTR
jgi:hypothetical protein